MNKFSAQDTPVERAGLSERVTNILRRAGCLTLSQAAEKNEAFFLAHQGVGPGSVREINRVLSLHGLGVLPRGDKRRYPPVPRYPDDSGWQPFLMTER